MRETIRRKIFRDEPSLLAGFGRCDVFDGDHAFDRLLTEKPVGDERTARRVPIVALAAAIFAQQPAPGAQPARNQDGLHEATPRTPAAQQSSTRSGWKSAARIEGMGR